MMIDKYQTNLYNECIRWTSSVKLVFCINSYIYLKLKGGISNEKFIKI
jgi:hypothetical protein